ncbi:MAG: cadherin-like beta sandwich domain-containing protein [Firmicutes bacterium]|nr:cadherin-like beta sandwich domain-containing protein [Bacillota bacterium]
MKRIKYFIFMIGVCLLGLGTVNAAKFNVTTNKTTVVVGSTVKITVGVSGSDAAGWEYCLNYDSSMFSLTSHSSTCVLGGTLAGNKSVTFTFKAKKSGSYTFSLRDASILNDSAKEVLSSSGKVTVKAKTQAEIEASYSTNANLSALRVVDHVISPDFDKDKLEYTLEVENDVEKIEIKATRADSSASVSGTGVKNLSEGLNKFNIVVTAEKGNKKTYVINVTRKELNPIHVDVDGFNYTVVRKADVLEAPTYYSSTEIEIDGEMVPAFNSDITGYTLVGLKDEEGNIDLYRYTDTGYVLYKQIGTEGLVFIPGTNEKLITGYEQSKNITINNVNVKVYVDNSNSDYVLVYGMNASNGKSNWYIYDTLEGTFQRYEEKIITEEKKDKDIYFILTLVFGGVAGLTLLLVIILLSKNSKIRQKNEKLISMLQALREAKKDKDTFVDKSSEEAKESEKKRELQEELRKKQEEFMDTGENELVSDDVELEESTPVKKSKRGRKKKE